MIIQDSVNQLWSVENTQDKDLNHCWLGFRVKKVKNGFAPIKNAKTMLVRKAGSKVYSVNHK